MINHSDLKRTALYDFHLKLGAVMVAFSGWSMPVHYGSQIEEHHSVRQRAGMFDVSHMGIIDIEGIGAQDFLRYLLANNIDKLKTPNSALYTCLVNEVGGILDDLIVYFIADNRYRLVVNSATTKKDLDWIIKQGEAFKISINLKTDLALIAVQGPEAIQKVAMAMPKFQQQLKDLKSFHFFKDKDYLIAKTGYTGEDGIEIMLPSNEAGIVWQQFLAAKIPPIGLGARDTLRLEAGFNLYGQDMDESVTPFESNLGWTVALEPKDRNFIGKEALTKQKIAGVQQKLVGLLLLDKGVLRHNQVVLADNKTIGIITSGSFSPTLKQSIALARIDSTAAVNKTCKVEVRGKTLCAKIVQPPFIRK